MLLISLVLPLPPFIPSCSAVMRVHQNRKMAGNRVLKALTPESALDEIINERNLDDTLGLIPENEFSRLVRTDRFKNDTTYKDAYIKKELRRIRTWLTYSKMKYYNEILLH